MRRSVLMLLSLPLLALPAAAAAQQAVEVTGRVVDEINGTPLANVVVRLPAERRYTLTDEDGGFGFADVPIGSHRLVVMRLGYHDHVSTVRVDGPTTVVVHLSPRPVEVEGLSVDNGFMDRLATRRGSAMNTFWKIFDEDDISGSGTDDPLEFLEGTAHLVIRPCMGLGADSSQTCLVGMARASTHNALRRTGYTGRASGGSGRPTSGRRPMLLDQMINGWAHRVWGSRPRMGDNYGRVRVFVDDLPLPGSLDELAEYSLEDMERVETYGQRGERQIRFYTKGYMSLVMLGEIRPDFNVPAADRYDPWDEDPPTGRRGGPGGGGPGGG